MSTTTNVQTALLDNLNRQSTLLPLLVSSISHLSVPSQSSRHLPPLQTIHAELTTLDDELAHLLERARKHQDRWQTLQRLKHHLVTLETENRQTLIDLEHGRRELEALVTDGKANVQLIELASSNRQDPEILLAYASSLAPYTSAPPSFDPALPPTGIFRPPFPPEATLRRGKLGMGESLNVVGMTSEVSDHPTLETNLPAHFLNPMMTTRAQPSHEIFDLDLNSDLDD